MKNINTSKLADYQPVTTPPHKIRLIAIIFVLILAFSACRHTPIVCGVPICGTPFQLMQQLAYNPASEAFPIDFLIAFKDTTFVYCITEDGEYIILTCVTDTATQEIQHVIY